MNLVEKLINAGEVILPVSRKKRVLEGICTNCENRRYCVWRENNKIVCEHYQ